MNNAPLTSTELRVLDTAATLKAGAAAYLFVEAVASLLAKGLVEYRTASKLSIVATQLGRWTWLCTWMKSPPASPEGLEVSL